MFEIIVRVCRAIANRQRLRILRVLARQGESVPTVLGKRLSLPKNVLSHHLRLLASNGLICSRKSGAHCYYEFRSSYAEGTLSGAMSGWLKALLGDPTAGTTNCGVRELRNSSPGDDAQTVQEAIFQAATGFTDLRRLQIVSFLETHGEATVEELMGALKMSRFAASRHTAKLRRRSYLTARRCGGLLVFELSAKAKSVIHARMLEIVRKAGREKMGTMHRK